MDFKVVTLRGNVDAKLIDRVVEEMANDMDNDDVSAIWGLLHTLATSSPSNRKTILEYLPEEEWDNFVPQQ